MTDWYRQLSVRYLSKNSATFSQMNNGCLLISVYEVYTSDWSSNICVFFSRMQKAVQLCDMSQSVIAVSASTKEVVFCIGLFVSEITQMLIGEFSEGLALRTRNIQIDSEHFKVVCIPCRVLYKCSVLPLTLF